MNAAEFNQTSPWIKLFALAVVGGVAKALFSPVVYSERPVESAAKRGIDLVQNYRPSESHSRRETAAAPSTDEDSSES